MSSYLGLKIVNKKAGFNYHLDKSIEAGLVLLGSEVKSILDGKVNFKDSYIKIVNGEAFWVGAHVSPYLYSHQFNHDPERDRKLLLHITEIRHLQSAIKEKGLTIVPMRLYVSRGKIKLEIALGKGKKLYDKRESLKEKDLKRDLEQL